MISRGGAWKPRIFLAGVIGLLAGAACSSSSRPATGDLGVARIALAAAPMDVQCLEVVASGARSVTKQATLVPGTSVTFEMDRLPLGSVQFSATAFADGCANTTGSSPTWVSDPVLATITSGVVAQVQLIMHRNGRASVSVDFEDDDGGVGGRGGAAGAPPPDGGAGAGGLDGGTGPSCGGASALDVWTTDDVGTTNAPPEGIRGLFAIAPDDVWVTTDQHVRRWDGTTWTNVPVDFDTSDLLGNVWASGANDVWLSGSHIMRWNGAVWTDMAIPAAYTSSKLVGLGPHDVWAWTTKQIGHWDGSSWTDRSPSPDPVSGWIAIQALWLASADDVWLAGYGSAGALIEHWSGASWESSPVTTTIRSFTGMWGSSPTDIWLLGDRGMMHYDGISWMLADPTLKGAGGIWGSCASDVWATLAPIYSSRVAHFDGAKWSTIPLTGGQTTSLISGTGPDDIWLAVAYGPTVYHRHPGDPAAACGNARLDPGEQCDPPDGRGCGSSCQLIPGCGDGVLEAGESCDPPDQLTCGVNCQPIPTCGNGLIDPGEDCDPPLGGPGSPGPWCDSTCHIPRCGNGVIDPGENCDPPVGYWSPGHASSYYCGFTCLLVDACVECKLTPSTPACGLLLSEHGCPP